MTITPYRFVPLNKPIFGEKSIVTVVLEIAQCDEGEISLPLHVPQFKLSHEKEGWEKWYEKNFIFHDEEGEWNMRSVVFPLNCFLPGERDGEQVQVDAICLRFYKHQSELT